MKISVFKGIIPDYFKFIKCTITKDLKKQQFINMFIVVGLLIPDTCGAEITISILDDWDSFPARSIDFSRFLFTTASRPVL
jgi:hypothetical protein